MFYNLLDEPWLPVGLLDGRPERLSLLDTFRFSNNIRRVQAELPTQSFAVFRVLLAICHDAIGFHEEDDVAEALENGLDVARIEQYLERYRDRFDLFHPQRPFMQVASLRTAKDEHSGLEKLISDVPNGVPFLTVRQGKSLESISPAEATQWLIHCQAFDSSGIRSAAVGDPETKGGKGYPIGPAWCGQIGGVLLHGKNLAESLVLNLVPTPENPEDLPVWALAKPQTEQRSLEPRPVGPVSLLTWQSRRIRLVHNDKSVIGVVLAQGDKMTPQNRHELEQMTAWRYSKPQTKKFGIDVYMPLKHDPARSGWRGLPAILATPRIVDHKEQTRRPGVVENVGSLSFDFGDLEYSVGIELIGMDYGPQEATVAELVHDMLDVRASMLGKEAVHIRAVIQDATESTDRCVWELGRMAAQIAEAAGDFDGIEGSRDRATLAAWAAVDQPAREWLSGLSAQSDITESKRDWHKTLRSILTEQANLLAKASPPQAIAGRKGKRGFLSVDVAHRIFLSAMRKEIPLAYPKSNEEESKDE